MAVTHPRISPREFRTLLATLDKHPLELVDGEVVVIPPPGGFHAFAMMKVIVALGDWQRSVGDDGLVLPEIRLPLGRNSLGPDVAYWVAERRPQLSQADVEVAPDLVVEVQSPSTAANDRGPKRRIYFEAGVREQWLIDPGTGDVTIVDEENDERQLVSDDAIESRMLPGFSLPIAELLAR